jgi:poly-gamma-glutamate synthesis protein (capsule biosynthesis protein)
MNFILRIPDLQRRVSGLSLPVFGAALILLIAGLAALDFSASRARAVSESLVSGVPANWWIYLRGNVMPGDSEELAELLIVGDVMLGRGVALEGGVFDDVAAQLRSADLTLGNFEGAVPPEGWGAIPPERPENPAAAGDAQCAEYSLSLPVPRSAGWCPSPAGLLLLAPAESVPQLQAAGFDLLGLANNHAFDSGEAGLANTIQALGAAGIGALGARPEPTVPSDPTVRQINGISIAFLAFNLVPGAGRSGENPTGEISPTEEILAAIREARGRADAVAVLMHWGWEYQLHVDPGQRALARSMADAGADLILGSHPHVAQELEFLCTQDGRISSTGQISTTENAESAEINKEKNSALSACSGANFIGAGREGLVAYSLGNFVFDQEGGETGQGLAVRALFDEDGLRAVQILPVRAGPRPRWMPRAEGDALVERVSPPPARLGYTCQVASCQPLPSTQVSDAKSIGSNRGEEASGLFWSGRVDLTGDGVPEIVRRQRERAAIYQDGSLVWESPPDWRVVDLALGDPNDDGRNELLLALRKPLPGGGESSHPFILGYRGGRYRVLWGGSATSEPLLEVELGDVDGEGVPELVVLEERGVSVWRWHGWGFALLWRSPEGEYQDLVLIPHEDGSQSISLAVKFVPEE